MYNIGAGSKDISPMNWGKYIAKDTLVRRGFSFSLTRKVIL